MNLQLSQLFSQKNVRNQCVKNGQFTHIYIQKHMYSIDNLSQPVEIYIFKIDQI